MNLCWNVYTEDVNNRIIEIYNVFEHQKFKEEVVDSFNKCWKEDEPTTSLSKFKERVKDLAQYYFWGRCEYEIILSDWPPAPEGKFNKKKVSVYDQLSLNWDSFINYTVNNILFS